MYATDPSKLQPLTEFTPGNEIAEATLRASYEKRIARLEATIKRLRAKQPLSEER